MVGALQGVVQVQSWSKVESSCLLEELTEGRALTAEQVGPDTTCGNLIASSALRV